MGQTIVVGDIHGCYFELMDLLSRIGVVEEDKVICVGDLIARGPRNREVLEFGRKNRNFQSVLGNHEYLLLQHYRGRPVELEPEHFQAISELGKDFSDYMGWVSEWPLYMDLSDYLVVHAGIRPGRPLEKQTIEDLTQLRTLDGPNPGSREGTPWFERYRGKKTSSLVTGSLMSLFFETML